MFQAQHEQSGDVESVLIQKAATGDLEAFNQLVLMYQNIAYHYAYSLLGDASLSSDVTQESFIKAFQSITNLRGGSFKAWLLKIVANSAYDLLRRARRHPTQPLFPEDDDGTEVESPAWLADPSPSIQATVEHQEEAERLYELIDELPDVYRSVLTLVDIQEMDYTEAARILGVPLGTIKSRLARARLQLKERLQSDPRYMGEYHTAELNPV